MRRLLSGGASAGEQVEAEEEEAEEEEEEEAAFGEAGEASGPAQCGGDGGPSVRRRRSFGGFHRTPVAQLTAAAFDETVLRGGGRQAWMVAVLPPRCGRRCAALEPEWVEAAIALLGEVRFGAVDCPQAAAAVAVGGVCDPERAKASPAIFFYSAGSSAPAMEYTGGRDAEPIIAFARALHPPPVEQGGGTDPRVGDEAGADAWEDDDDPYDL
ncbi:hypothetical protein GPECTOR_726g885 [Gonium pectorale]|uniref:Thioredoxin domain-containing protein n=1 Tax=Gonium pectorale TaxID=33097 RepID=A0A150FU49_GONPE|nr:hypothetical protein GPECTOR_726g885 [Gonium pectorale]|eukprot:KXZ41142.1 hypothetical protein GPECTOR_726g885 [Gonium pectorale]